MIMYGLYNPSQDYHVDNYDYGFLLDTKDENTKEININTDIRKYIEKERGFMFDFLNILSKNNSHTEFKS